MKKLLLIILALSPVLLVFSQEKEEEKKFGISFSGFVKNDFYFDTRQTVAAREGHFLLWPDKKIPDVNGKDINAKTNFNMLAVQSRLTGKITGPDAFGAKTSGVIEGDFFAQLNDNINLFRLRHAYLQLNWKNTELITGQTWNPLFVTGCFPGTVSFNTGTPIQSFARNPQIRLTQSIGNFKIMGAMLSQRDYATYSWDAVEKKVLPSSIYLRNSGIPDLHFQLQYSTENKEAGTSFLAGAGVAYKNIVPRLSSVTDTTYQVDEKVSSLALIAYVNVKLKPVTIKLQGRYGENISDVLSISGYAVKEVTDTITGERSYTPLRNISVWGDFQTNGAKLQVGVFSGILINLGTKEAMSAVNNPVYGLGTNIVSLFRISPRLIWNSAKVRIALEFEYTAACYGKDYDVNYVPDTFTRVSNFRTLLSTYYFF